MQVINCGGSLMTLDKPKVMGIVNLTEDSFYKGDLTAGIDGILAMVETMIKDGAAFIDIGAQSTKPGSLRKTADEEIAILKEYLAPIVSAFPKARISIDTYHSKVAKFAIENGACIVNDISGGNLDHEMMSVVAALKAPYICMHMKGVPETMQQSAHYENVTKEVLDYFIEKKDACAKAGIQDVIIDPGFGFGKTIAHNFQLLGDLRLFKMLSCPVLVGLSRKATVWKTLETTPEGSLNGTTVLNTIALMNGADILRVHDVKEAVEAIKLTVAFSSASEQA